VIYLNHILCQILGHAALINICANYYCTRCLLKAGSIGRRLHGQFMIQWKAEVKIEISFFLTVSDIVAWTMQALKKFCKEAMIRRCTAR
jgi:hypothetical protein